jgi:hypothetical protein
MAALPGVYRVRATFQPTPADTSLLPTDPNFPKALPCSPARTLVTIIRRPGELTIRCQTAGTLTYPGIE